MHTYDDDGRDEREAANARAERGAPAELALPDPAVYAAEWRDGAAFDARGALLATDAAGIASFAATLLAALREHADGVAAARLFDTDGAERDACRKLARAFAACIDAVRS